MPGWRIQNPAPVPPGVHLPVLDELKGWAMLLVILYHGGGVLGWTNWLHGEVGVDLFLIISGFTLVHTSRDLSPGRFLRRRILRIYPAYWVALATFLVLGGVYYEAWRTADNIVAHVLGIHAYYRMLYFADINDSFWFISLIIAAYGVFLLVRRKLADVGWIAGLGLLLFAAVNRFYVAIDAAGAIGHLGMRVPSFFVGLVAGQLAGPVATEFRFSPMLAIGLLASVYLGFTRNIIPVYTLAALALIAGYLLVRRSLHRHPDGRFLLAGFGLLGTYSYEIFLFHQPLIRDYNRLVWAKAYGVVSPNPWQLGAGIVVALAVTCVIAAVVHHATAWLFQRRAPAAGNAPTS
jgi:exopolysaccharide production protein ExoZ